LIFRNKTKVRIFSDKREGFEFSIGRIAASLISEQVNSADSTVSISSAELSNNTS